MKHYRRKPLQLIDQGLPESVTNLLDHVEMPPSRVSDPGNLSVQSKAITEPIAEDIQPMIGETEAIPSPDMLVQQAAAILGNDRSAPLHTAQAVASPLNLGPTTSSAPASYSVPGLVGEMHEFVNELASLISLKSDLAGSGQGQTPSRDASVPLLQPSRPSHAGETVQISFTVHNDSTEPTQATFFCTDLYNCQGELIPRHAVSITPNTLSLAPDVTDSIRVSIQLPQTLPKGEYSGVVMAPELSYLKAMISLKVT